MTIAIAVFLPVLLLAQSNYSFGSSIRVNDDPPGIHLHATEQRAIACRGDTVYLVWSDDRYESGLDPNCRVFFSKSTDAGSTWSPNLLIGHNLDTLWCSDPHIALDAFGDIYVTYTTQNEITDNCDVYVVKSTDGGFSFSVPVMANDSSVVIAQGPSAIAVDSSGQHVYVVWVDDRNLQYDRDIYFAHSADAGASFLPSVRINDDTISAYQWDPVIACDKSGQKIYVTWYDGRDSAHGYDVYFSRSTDYGQTFGANYPINDTVTTGDTSQRTPSICYKNGIIYAVWRDQRDSYCLYFAKSTDNGVSFGTNVRVPDDPNAYGNHPSITADDSGRIFIVWSDRRSALDYEDEIYFSFSTDSGQTFSPNVCVNDHLGAVTAWDWDPSICVNDSGKVFVAWDSDRSDPSHMNPDIYFSRGFYLGIQENHYQKPSIMIQCSPNPFDNQLVIQYQATGTRQKLSVKIYDINGRLIKDFSPPSSAGQSSSLIWHGDDERGCEISVGIYFIEFVNEKEVLVRKVIKVGGLK